MDSAIASRDREFFLSLIVFQVEDCLFRVLRNPFEKESSVFHDMFELPNTGGDGNGEDRPIRLDDITAHEFRSFLQVLFAAQHHDALSLSIDTWLSVLKLAHMWTFAGLTQHAITKLDKSKMGPTLRIHTAYKYDIFEWIPKAYSELTNRENALTNEEAEALGWQDAFKISCFREQKMGKMINHFTSGHKRKRTCNEGHESLLKPDTYSKKCQCYYARYEEVPTGELVDDGCEKFDVPGALKQQQQNEK